MRILAISPAFYPQIGGGENYILNLGRQLAQKHEYAVISPAKTLKGTQQIGNIGAYYLPYKKIFGTEVISLRHIYRVIKILKPDIIHGHGPSVTQDLGLLLSKILKIPMVTTYHSHLRSERAISRIYIKFSIRIVLKNMKKVIVTSKSTYCEMLEKGGLYKANLVFIPVGVDYNRFANIQNSHLMKEKFGLKGKKIVLFVGRLDSQHQYKRLDLLINSLLLVKRKIQNIYLVVIGDGDNITEYQRLVKLLGIQDNVSFQTNVKDDELPYWYSAANVFVLPSPSNQEGFGIVLLEAMSSGIPVITSDRSGGAFSVKEGKSGLLYKAYDIYDLSCKMITILTDDTISSEMGKNGRRYASKYDWRLIAKAVESTYLHVINK
jgi:glycosyltransferase involved in cell wall biosynthesis